MAPRGRPGGGAAGGEDAAVLVADSEWGLQLELPKRRAQLLAEFQRRAAAGQGEGGREAPGAVLGLKFLRARKFDLDAALAMYADNLAMRQKWELDGLLECKLPNERVLEALWPHHFIGRDVNNRPVRYEQCGCLDAVGLVSEQQIDPRELVRFYMKQQELIRHLCKEACRREGVLVEKVVHVLDIQSTSMGSHLNSTARGVFSKIAAVSNVCYPESLGKMVVINSNRIFPIFWNFVKTFIDPGTRERIEIFGLPPGKGAKGGWPDRLRELLGHDPPAWCFPEGYGTAPKGVSYARQPAWETLGYEPPEPESPHKPKPEELPTSRGPGQANPFGSVGDLTLAAEEAERLERDEDAEMTERARQAADTVRTKLEAQQEELMSAEKVWEAVMDVAASLDLFGEDDDGADGLPEQEWECSVCSKKFAFHELALMQQCERSHLRSASTVSLPTLTDDEGDEEADDAGRGGLPAHVLKDIQADLGSMDDDLLGPDVAREEWAFYVETSGVRARGAAGASESTPLVSTPKKDEDEQARYLMSCNCTLQ